MGSAVTVVDLYPPIALATVVNAFVLALAWRGHKAEMRAGEPPWWMILLLLGYIGSISAFFYYRGSEIRSGADLFMAALAGEAAGVVATGGILRALFFTRGMPRAEIVAAYIVAIGAVGFLIWATTSGPRL